MGLSAVFKGLNWLNLRYVPIEARACLEALFRGKWTELPACCMTTALLKSDNFSL
jgi:hypothetical protein